MFATREAFAATGGFSEQVYAGEEVLFSLRMQRWGRRHGKRFSVLREPRVQTSARKAEWFSLCQHLALVTLLALFPFALRSRRLCGFWYRLPGAESNGGRARQKLHPPPKLTRREPRSLAQIAAARITSIGRIPQPRVNRTLPHGLFAPNGNLCTMVRLGKPGRTAGLHEQ